MQIQAITSQNNCNQYRKSNNTSFKSFKVTANLRNLFKTPDLAKPFVEEIAKWQEVPLNLRELIDVEKLTVTGKRVLKEFFKLINDEKLIQDYPIEMLIATPGRMYEHTHPRYFAKLPVCDDNGEIILDDGQRINVEIYGNLKYLMGIGHGEAVQMESIGFTKKQIRSSLTEHIQSVADKVDEFAAKKQEEKLFENLQNSIESANKKTDIEKAVANPADDMLPVASTVCTIDDIYNYLMNHITEIDEGRIFNKPVTKDGESLLIGLVHVLPNKENVEKYISLVRNMGKMPFIDFNQKDVMGIPAIAHVLNSQNKILFAAFTDCKDLKYEPSLEFEFGSITDNKFKELVENSKIFENKQNKEFETIFGKPNPVYKE